MRKALTLATEVALAFAVCCGNTAAQGRVDPRQLNEKLIAVVPIVGAGTYVDPKRPAITPTSDELRMQTGILSYRWVPSDDGRYAIVEYTGRNSAAFARLRTDGRIVAMLERGKHSRADTEKELKKYKKDFSLDGEVKKP